MNVHLVDLHGTASRANETSFKLILHDTRLNDDHRVAIYKTAGPR